MVFLGGDYSGCWTATQYNHQVTWLSQRIHWKSWACLDVFSNLSRCLGSPTEWKMCDISATAHSQKRLSHSHLIFWHLNWSMVIELMMLINQGNFRSHHFAQLPWAKHGDRWAENQGTHRWNKNKVEACGIKWGKLRNKYMTPKHVKCWVLQLPFKINC